MLDAPAYKRPLSSVFLFSFSLIISFAKRNKTSELPRAVSYILLFSLPLSLTHATLSLLDTSFLPSYHLREKLRSENLRFALREPRLHENALARAGTHIHPSLFLAFLSHAFLLSFEKKRTSNVVTTTPTTKKGRATLARPRGATTTTCT